MPIQGRYFVTAHAMHRYRGRILDRGLSDAQIRTRIQDGLESAEHFQPTSSGDLRVWCPGRHPFRALVGQGEGEAAAVITITPWAEWRRNPPAVDLGLILRGYRRTAGVRGADVAHDVGCSRGTISHWETGRVHVPPTRVRRVLAAYRVSVSDLERHMRLMGHTDWTATTAPSRLSARPEPSATPAGVVLGALLTQYRKRRNLHQEQAVTAIPGLGKTAVWMYETGRRIPAGSVLSAMLVHYHIMPETFLRDASNAGLALDQGAPWETPTWRLISAPPLSSAPRSADTANAQSSIAC